MAKEMTLADTEPSHVATYRETLMKDLSAPTVKQHLSELDYKQLAIIAWVSVKNSLQPKQALGGYLPDGIIIKV